MYKLKNRIHSACNVIRRRYSPQEVPGRGIHNVIAAAMSICVAYGNKVVDTRRPQPAGCGSKYDICSVGRSMIEMLGVLAIIAVLSVGGIASYSKAMEKFKINKIIYEYSSIVAGLIEHKDNILRHNSDNQVGLVDIMTAIRLFPNNWKRRNGMAIYDSFGNDVYFYSLKVDGGKIISIDVYMAREKFINNFSKNFCFELFNNFAYPLHSEIFRVSVASFDSKKGWHDAEYFGDKYCGKNRKCLKNASITDFKTACQSCHEDKSKCNFGIRF